MRMCVADPGRASIMRTFARQRVALGRFAHALYTFRGETSAGPNPLQVCLAKVKAGCLLTHNRHMASAILTRCERCFNVQAQAVRSQARLHQDPKASLHAIQRAIQWEKGAGFVNCVGEKCVFADYLVCNSRHFQCCELSVWTP